MSDDGFGPSTYQQLNAILAGQKNISASLALLIKQGTAIMSALTDLQASMASLTTAITSATTEISSLLTQLGAATAGTPDAAVEAIVQQINTQVTALNSAVAAASTPPAKGP
jgi:uncharacterized protein YukE